jgi:hypothetical protein
VVAVLTQSGTFSLSLLSANTMLRSQSSDTALSVMLYRDADFFIGLNAFRGA